MPEHPTPTIPPSDPALAGGDSPQEAVEAAEGYLQQAVDSFKAFLSARKRIEQRRNWEVVA